MFLQTQELTKDFGKLRAVDQVSLEIRKGDIHAIIGPNGAGKSTYFNLITGYHSASSGKVFYKGQEVTSIPPYTRCRLGITRSFQITNIFKTMTVFQNVRNAILSRNKIRFNFLSRLDKMEAINRQTEEVLRQIGLLERKDIAEKLKNYFTPIIGALIKDKMKSIGEEIIDLDKQFDLMGDKRGINLNELLEQNFNLLLPKLTEFYLSGLEKKYHATINNISDTQEITNIAGFYSEKIDILASIIENFNEYAPKLERLLKPYEELTILLKKTIVTVVAEIWRRKEEYLNYLETIKKERLSDTVRNYINAKINETNEFINKYQDETSIIVREEFPQLKQIRQILTTYKEKINAIKKEVRQKFSELKEKEVEVYPLIKLWEDNFDRKKQQLNFLLSLLLNKLYKNFKDLIESEDLMFERIAEIKSEEESSDLLPLNFALSSYLVDKLTEKELNERISEMQSRMNKLGHEITLYKSEISKLEETLANKVKTREGITSTTLQCTVCHKHINFAKDKIIKCPFCDSVFHYLCVAFWLSKYNACPMCNNNFLEPGSGIFENSEENQEEE